jgi:hypothetical protein
MNDHPAFGIKGLRGHKTAHCQGSFSKGIKKGAENLFRELQSALASQVSLDDVISSS